mmetsp:Transcript_1410/g.3149  ORF Transcript_1410/g.3149 Transcript_1410/m.3149 type:complete len:987 (-) Transcript_1410:472-3432(-)
MRSTSPKGGVGLPARPPDSLEMSHSPHRPRVVSFQIDEPTTPDQSTTPEHRPRMVSFSAQNTMFGEGFVGDAHSPKPLEISREEDETGVEHAFPAAPVTLPSPKNVGVELVTPVVPRPAILSGDQRLLAQLNITKIFKVNEGADEENGTRARSKSYHAGNGETAPISTDLAPRQRATSFGHGDASPVSKPETGRRERGKSLIDFFQGRGRVDSLAPETWNKSGEGLQFLWTSTRALSTVHPDRDKDEFTIIAKLFDVNSKHVILDSRSLELTSILSALLNTLEDVPAEQLPAEARLSIRGSLTGQAIRRDCAFIKGTMVFMHPDERVTGVCPAIARLAVPVNMGAPDESMTRFVALIVGPKPPHHHHCDSPLIMTTRTLMTLLMESEFHSQLVIARSVAELADAYLSFHRRYMMGSMFWAQSEVEGTGGRARMFSLLDGGFGAGSPGGRPQFKSFAGSGVFAGEVDSVAASSHGDPSEEEHHGVHLQWSRRFCGGIIDDINRRLPWYLSDFKDGFSLRTAQSVCFMFFATMAPTIAFGGLLQTTTNKEMGIVEMLLSQSFVGIAFALVGGQPLLVFRPTGPVVAFIGATYVQSQALGVPFLVFYSWVGIWTALILFIVAVTDLSFVIRYFTAFSENVFEALVSTLFLAEAFKHAIKYFSTGNFEPDVRVFSIVLLLFTAWAATVLKEFRRSRYLSPGIRMFFSDFGIAIAIAAGTLVSWVESSIGGLLLLETAPTWGTFTPTDHTRDWVVPFWDVTPAVVGNTSWLGLLLAVLFFIEGNATNQLVCKPSNRLKKGPAFHLDMLVTALLVLACSFFGLPVAHASAPHSPMMLRSLAVLEENVIDGRVERTVIQVIETRLAALLLNGCIGFLLLILPLFSYIPLPVIFGVFLFLGASTIADNPFFERILLLPTEPGLYPPNHLIRKCKPIWKVHLYTLLQLVCLAAIWIVKQVQGVLFPLVIVALVPFRFFVMPFMFTPEQLALIDVH